jgi:hypothetical protein
MTTKRDKSRQPDEPREREYMRGGKRTSPNDPEDEIRGESDLLGHRRRRRLMDDELDFDTDQSWGSE